MTGALFPDAGTLSDEIVVGLPDAGIRIDRWVNYAVSSDFLSPSDAWSLTTAGPTLSPAIVQSLYNGARLTLSVNGKVAGGGHIDHVSWHHDRSGGTVYNIQGRDVFGAIVDAGADPGLYNFTAEQTLEDVVYAMFAHFGFMSPSQFVISNDANRSVMTGIRTTTKKGKPLKSIKIAQQLKPYPAEGQFAYLTRFLHRFGLWCWPSADQQTVIVGGPSYDLPPTNKITRKADGSVSNVLSGGVSCNTTDQPAAILATGRSASGGADWARSGLKVIMVNELTGLFSTAIVDLINRNPDAAVIPLRSSMLSPGISFMRADPIARPMFLHDDEAKTLDQLTRFVYREMSLRQQKMWSATYVVRGHTQNGVPWACDTIVSVDDDAGKGFHGPMYVRGRTFEKSRSGGTTTRLDLILPGTIDFGGFDASTTSGANVTKGQKDLSFNVSADLFGEVEPEINLNNPVIPEKAFDTTSLDFVKKALGS